MTVVIIAMITACANNGLEKNFSNYLLQENPGIKKIENIYLSTKFIAIPDSAEITDYLLNIQDMSVSGLTQKLLLSAGSKIYFNDFLNEGPITQKQIENIINNSEKYQNIGITPNGYIVFGKIEYLNVYGEQKTEIISFLISPSDSIMKTKSVEDGIIENGIFKNL